MAWGDCAPERGTARVEKRAPQVGFREGVSPPQLTREYWGAS